MLVDTSVWIDYFNGHASPQADYLASAIDAAVPLIIPGLVLTEILLGLRSEAEGTRIADLLSVYARHRNPTAATISRPPRSTGTAASAATPSDPPSTA